jgi:hypothetical protein
LFYLLFFGLLLPAVASVYGFIAVTFLFPNWGTDYFGVAGIPAFFFVEITAGMTILLASARSKLKGAHPPSGGLERHIFFLFVFTVAVHYLFYWPLVYGGYYPPIEAPESTAIIYGVKAFIPLIFLYGCLKFIRTQRQVELICWLFIIAGAELALELISFKGLDLLPSLGQYAFDERGRFKSLTENDPLAVGLISCVAGLCATYFLIVKKNLALTVVIPVLLLPAFAIYQRSIVIALAMALTFMIWRTAVKIKRLALIAACGIALAFMFWSGFDVRERVGSIYVGTPRDVAGPESIGRDPLSMDQLASRVGIWARAIEIFVYLFPLGTGEYMQRYFLASQVIPSLLIPLDLVAVSTYSLALVGEKTTEVHNGYIEYLVSYGLLGAISLGAFVTVTIKNYRLHGPISRRTRLLHILTYAVLIYCGAFYAVYSFPKLYMVYLFFFHNTFLLHQTHRVVE